MYRGSLSVLFKHVLRFGFDEYVPDRRYRKGVRHGISRTFGLKVTTNTMDNFQSISLYENGSVVGLVWKQLCGGAYLVGTVEDSGMYTTHLCIVNPDSLQMQIDYYVTV